MEGGEEADPEAAARKAAAVVLVAVGLWKTAEVVTVAAMEPAKEVVTAAAVVYRLRRCSSRPRDY